MTKMADVAKAAAQLRMRTAMTIALRPVIAEPSIIVFQSANNEFDQADMYVVGQFVRF